uniref:Macaca fascicularis brain cDNA clone: QflA-21459, similar to human mitogen-activated protein kinase kinase kinase 13(MAP3K13), mRNA, RefSeq: NM_004721.3 n=1 Tax=Macaca fascicularis TaxID=9541 RepID=I7GMA5_MACFA|nr:unnamed protein product [Macaca fascicularis]
MFSCCHVLAVVRAQQILVHQHSFYSNFMMRSMNTDSRLQLRIQWAVCDRWPCYFMGNCVGF